MGVLLASAPTLPDLVVFILGALMILGGAVGVIAWRNHNEDPTRVTYADVAGALTLIGLFASGIHRETEALAQSLGARLAVIDQLGLTLRDVDGLDRVFADYRAFNPDIADLALIVGDRIAVDSDPRRVGQPWPGANGTFDHTLELPQAAAGGQPDRLVISPGPCSPAEAGISVAAIRHFAGKIPILGVCLGHQSIGAAFGGKIIRAQELMHGKTSVITTTQEGVFRGLPQQFTVNRYHSLAIDRASCPAELKVTARTEDGEIMGVRHREFEIEGVQFHPESILSEHGHRLLENFLARAHA